MRCGVRIACILLYAVVGTTDHKLTWLYYAVGITVTRCKRHYLTIRLSS